jgi:repressor LexA
MFLGTVARAERDPATVGVPLVGAIAAGTPILAEEKPEDTLTLPRELAGETCSASGGRATR